MVHHIKEDDVILIEQTFAFLTPHGWIVPTWVQMLRDKDSPPCTVDIKQSMVYGQFPISTLESMMIRFLMISLALFVLGGCTSNSIRNEPITSPTSVTTMGETTQQFGSVVVTIDKHGQWVQLVSVGSAALVSEDPKHIDDALKRARASAYQNIVKFMGNQVSSKTISRAENEADLITHSGSDVTTERAAGLVKGVTFDQQYVEGDRVFARAVVSPKTVNSASQVRASMLGR